MNWLGIWVDVGVAGMSVMIGAGVDVFIIGGALVFSGVGTSSMGSIKL